MVRLLLFVGVHLHKFVYSSLQMEQVAVLDTTSKELKSKVGELIRHIKISEEARKQLSVIFTWIFMDVIEKAHLGKEDCVIACVAERQKE